MALSPAGDGVAAQMGAVALQQVCQADAEGQGTLVDKRKGQVGSGGLVVPVLVQRQIGPLGHFQLAEAADAPHFADAERYLQQLCVDMCGVHTAFLLENRNLVLGDGMKQGEGVLLKEKSPSQRNIFETSHCSTMYPRYHSNYAQRAPLQAPASPMH